MSSDKYRKQPIKYDRVIDKKDAAQKIRDYFNSEYKPIQDIVFIYNEGLEEIIDGSLQNKKRMESKELRYREMA